jgi:S1-C subfamily serine protease
MKKYVVLMMLCGFFAVEAAAEEGFHGLNKLSPDVVQKYWSNTAMIVIEAGESGYEGGSGLVFRSDNKHVYVVTNHHVAREGCKDIGAKCEKLELRFGFSWDMNERQFKVAESQASYVYTTVVLAYDQPDRDMSVLEFTPHPEHRFAEIELIRSMDVFETNMAVFAIGYPIRDYRYPEERLVSQVWSQGTLRGLAFESQSATALGTLIVHTADLLPGMSGGPILDSKGRLLGIQQAIMRIDTSGQDFSFGNIEAIVGIPFDKFAF